MIQPVHNEDPYGSGAAQRYDTYHRDSFRTRLTTKREISVLSKALAVAGPGITALDLPCGAGRFWPAFAGANVTDLIAADVSQGMLDMAEGNRLNATTPSRLECLSAFDINLPDDAVDFVACMRFLHHISRAEDRQQVLAELLRVSKEYVAVSLWVDGNLGARRRMRKTPVAAQPGFGRRICRDQVEVEQEFQQAGFEIVDYYDVWPKLSMWRLYLLAHG